MFGMRFPPVFFLWSLEEKCAQGADNTCFSCGLVKSVISTRTRTGLLFYKDSSPVFMSRIWFVFFSIINLQTVKGIDKHYVRNEI